MLYEVITTSYIRWFAGLTRHDVPLVGGKNASLGEMLSAMSGQGIRIPDGFATTAAAYRVITSYSIHYTKLYDG